MVKVKDGNRVLCTNCERMTDVERIFKKEILYFLVHLDILNSYRIAEKPASVN